MGWTGAYAEVAGGAFFCKMPEAHGTRRCDGVIAGALGFFLFGEGLR